MTHDIAIIGGGIVGLGTALALSEQSAPRLVVLEAEGKLAQHQTGHNSGVIHSGLYYKPGSLKAKNCAEGRELMYRYCAENGIAHERCGKVVVATGERELPALAELERRGIANGLQGVRRLGRTRSASTSRTSPGSPGCSCPRRASSITNRWPSPTPPGRGRGGDVRLDAKVVGCRRSGSEFVLTTTQGEVTCRSLVNCAGLQSDRVARLCGVDPGLQIVPFRGEYYDLGRSAADLVKNLIYPVPGPAVPVPRRPLHPDDRTAAWRPGRTPCSRSAARATRGRASARKTCCEMLGYRGSGGWPASITTWARRDVPVAQQAGVPEGAAAAGPGIAVGRTSTRPGRGCGPRRSTRTARRWTTSGSSRPSGWCTCSTPRPRRRRRRSASAGRSPAWREELRSGEARSGCVRNGDNQSRARSGAEPARRSGVSGARDSPPRGDLKRARCRRTAYSAPLRGPSLAPLPFRSVRGSDNAAPAVS